MAYYSEEIYDRAVATKVSSGSSDSLNLSITAPADQTIIIQNVGVIAPTVTLFPTSINVLPPRVYAQAGNSVVEAERVIALAGSSLTDYAHLSSDRVSAGFNKKVIMPGTTLVFTVGYNSISHTKQGSALALDVSFLRLVHNV